MIWIVMQGFWHFKSPICYNNSKSIHEIHKCDHITCNLFFCILFTYCSFIFHTMAKIDNPTNCDKIMYSTLVCLHLSFILKSFFFLTKNFYLNHSNMFLLHLYVEAKIQVMACMLSPHNIKNHVKYDHVVRTLFDDEVMEQNKSYLLSLRVDH